MWEFCLLTSDVGALVSEEDLSCSQSPKDTHVKWLHMNEEKVGERLESDTAFSFLEDLYTVSFCS